MGLYNLQYKQPSTMQEPPQKRSDRNDQSDACTKSSRINFKMQHEMPQSKRKDTAGTIKTKCIL